MSGSITNSNIWKSRNPFPGALALKNWGPNLLRKDMMSLDKSWGRRVNALTNSSCIPPPCSGGRNLGEER